MILQCCMFRFSQELEESQGSSTNLATCLSWALVWDSWILAANLWWYRSATAWDSIIYADLTWCKYQWMDKAKLYPLYKPYTFTQSIAFQQEPRMNPPAPPKTVSKMIFQLSSSWSRCSQPTSDIWQGVNFLSGLAEPQQKQVGKWQLLWGCNGQNKSFCLESPEASLESRKSQSGINDWWPPFRFGE